MFCDKKTDESQMFCPEHRHFEASRKIRTLNDIGKKPNSADTMFHVAFGIKRPSITPDKAKKFYEYCPSTEGLLPCWYESVDHLERWLSVCFEVFMHPNRDSTSKFPVGLFYDEFPEISDIDQETYFHGFWATYESIKAYGFDKRKPWDRYVPTLLHQLGAMQQFLPYHQAVDPTKYQTGDRFEWKTGVQNHTYTKDIFDMPEDRMPVCPALRLKEDLDGTSSPSFAGLEDMKPVKL